MRGVSDSTNRAASKSGRAQYDAPSTVMDFHNDSRKLYRVSRLDHAAVDGVGMPPRCEHRPTITLAPDHLK